MLRQYDREVTQVKGGDFTHAESLGQCDYGGIRGAQRQVAILRDQLSHPRVVTAAQFSCFEVPFRQGAQKRGLGPRPGFGCQEISHLSNYGRRHD
ncbi:hypothetical protein GCM10009765_76420 [Fodinicola feengrottensis]|uniref:Uncharacterized protein n=1 Tax=Fodinicola feengrottensis TaxID=435914 RepID=A0ABN2J209_9ACTN